MQGIAQKMRYLESSSTASSCQKGFRAPITAEAWEILASNVIVVMQGVRDVPAEVLEVLREGNKTKLPNGNFFFPLPRHTIYLAFSVLIPHFLISV